MSNKSNATLDLSYQAKYLKYKNKYIELKNLVGGNPPDEIDCKKIHESLKKLLALSKVVPINYEEINRLLDEYKVELKINVRTRSLFSSILYLLSIDINKIVNQDIKDSYEIRLYNVPEVEFIEGETNPKEYFMSDTFLNQMDVWYKQFLKEDFWECDLKTFMDEYYKFKQSRQSYLLYWTSLVNMSMLFARITKCRFYMETYMDKPFQPTPNNKDKFRFYADGRDYYYIRNEYMSTATMNKLRIYEITMWNKIKDILVELLINSFDCKYDTIYIMYKKLLCFFHNNNNSIHDITKLPNHLRFICSIFGSEKDTDFSGMIYNNIGQFESAIEQKVDTLEIDSYEKEFIYLSFLLPSAKKFGRHEFTNLVPSCANPIYVIDNTPLDLINIIGHDLRNHSLMDRKKNFIDLPEIKDFVDCIASQNKEDFLIYIHGLFHENRTNKPFSIETLKERLRLSETGEIDAKKENKELTDEIISEFKKFVACYYP